ncbi:hypothetical protein FCM35_KLT00661 [Carex littledalei]|uniref:Uncharacterized protein n=1 Tax=Carex littledalei TaxID=544730 RepID=A0A833RWW0_9POAL|nr:hypothetical protein FCM35_KLT00661 [Carex littledalei]
MSLFSAEPTLLTVISASHLCWLRFLPVMGQFLQLSWLLIDGDLVYRSRWFNYWRPHVNLVNWRNAKVLL